MKTDAIVLVVAAAMKVVKQYQQRVLFQLKKLIGTREPGLRATIALVDVSHRVSLRIMTMPIQSQEIITRDSIAGAEL